jgi:hypothetical protein
MISFPKNLLYSLFKKIRRPYILVSIKKKKIGMRTLTEKRVDGNFLLPPERLAMRASEGRTAAVLLLELLVLWVY